MQFLCCPQQRAYEVIKACYWGKGTKAENPIDGDEPKHFLHLLIFSNIFFRFIKRWFTCWISSAYFAGVVAAPPAKYECDSGDLRPHFLFSWLCMLGNVRHVPDFIHVLTFMSLLLFTNNVLEQIWILCFDDWCYSIIRNATTVAVAKVEHILFFNSIKLAISHLWQKVSGHVLWAFCSELIISKGQHCKNIVTVTLSYPAYWHWSTTVFY